jgi:hypothetical protein
MKTLIKLASQRVSLPVLNCILVTDSAIVASDIDLRITIPNPGIKPGLYHGKGFDSDKVRTPADIDATQFPESVNFGDHIGAQIFSPDSWKSMQWVMQAMCDEVTRYYLGGVCFYPNAAIATDGHRLHKMPLGASLALPEKGVIVPRGFIKFVDSLVKEYKASPVFDFLAHGISARVGGAILESRYIDGTFPDCERVIPQDGVEAGVFNPENLKKGLKDLKAAAKIAGKKEIHIACNGAGVAKSLVNDNLQYDIGVAFLDKDSNCFEIGFNAEYLADLPMGNLVHNGAGSPIRVQTDSGLVGVCMPVRLPNLH